jgi:ubiquinone/menaquinone biosynthesis C-methylase UbiE
MATALDKLVFDAAQAARVGWFFGHKILAERVAGPLPMPAKLRGRKRPDRRQLIADLWHLFERDWRNIAAGLYLPPEEGRGSPLAGLRRAADFFADLRAVEALRHGSRRDRRLPSPPDRRYPAYYLQKFHFQSGGYLSVESAERYDYQVEVLFGGGAAAMRRQALVPLRAALRRQERGSIGARLLDIGCGTGQFLRQVKRNYPRLAVTGLDLSLPYLAVAARRLANWSGVALDEGNAEALPYADATFDVVTCVYLFHELPPRARLNAAAEIRRVLRPGGTLILVDSLQTGDEPRYDALLDWFPVAFHEPYYASYLRVDLDRLIGLVREESAPAYFSKVVTYRR